MDDSQLASPNNLNSTETFPDVEAEDTDKPKPPSPVNLNVDETLPDVDAVSDANPDSRKLLLKDVRELYLKLCLLSKQRDRIETLCSDVEKMCADLQAITKLEHCKELETISGLQDDDAENVEKARVQHEEFLMESNNFSCWAKTDCENTYSKSN